MNDALRKAIDDLHILERMKGVDHPTVITERQKLAKFIDKAGDPPPPAGPHPDDHYIKALTKLHHAGDDMGSGHHVDEVHQVEDPHESFNPQRGDRYVKVRLYDEGKSEGGQSTYAVNNGQARLAGTSGSGPWGIPPGSDTLNFPKSPKGFENPKSIPTHQLHDEIKQEHNDWKDRWKEGAED